METGKRTADYSRMVRQLRRCADECVYVHDWQKLFETTRKQRAVLHGILKTVLQLTPDVAVAFGLQPTLPSEVHELRRAARIGPDSQCTRRPSAP
jgi:hypothetical protein